MAPSNCCTPVTFALIEQARSHGDILVVGIESESKLARSIATQGARLPGLPITPSAERAEVVAALAAVDFAVEFDPNSSPPFAERLAPDVIIKGGNPASDKKGFQLRESSVILGGQSGSHSSRARPLDRAPD